MSENTTKSLVIIEEKAGFSKKELARIEEHVKSVGMQPLPPMVVEQLFEQYIGGSSLSEICKTFPEYSPGSILYSAYHYNWPAERDDFTTDLQGRIKQKVLLSKFRQLELVDNMIKVAFVEANTAMMAYLKHPSDKNIPKTLRIKTIKELAMAIEMMSTVIGQDNNKNINVSGSIVTDSKDESPSNNKPVIGELSDAVAKTLIKSLNKATKSADIVEGEVVNEKKER